MDCKKGIAGCPGPGCWNCAGNLRAGHYSRKVSEFAQREPLLDELHKKPDFDRNVATRCIDQRQIDAGGTKVLQNGHQSVSAQVVIGIEAGADSEFLLFDLPLAY
jgi:hypothetical protein